MPISHFPSAKQLRNRVTFFRLRCASEDCFCDQCGDFRQDLPNIFAACSGTVVIVNENVLLHCHRTPLDCPPIKDTATVFWQHTQYPKAIWKAIDKRNIFSASKLVILSTKLFVFLFLSQTGSFIIGIPSFVPAADHIICCCSSYPYSSSSRARNSLKSSSSSILMFSSGVRVRD